MKTLKIYSISLLFCTTVLCGACEEFLEAKPDQALLIPTELDDFQVLLDNDRYVMNREPALALMGTDEIQINAADWAGLSTVVERNAYLWQVDVFEDFDPSDWNLPYQQVFYANVVLEGLDKIAITPENKEQWHNLKGSALFYRSYAFYSLLSLFAPAYSPNTSSDLGIPIRLTANINAPVSRLSVEDGYQEVLSSLKMAAGLLPATSAFPTRPNKTSTYSLLSRIYLSMANYEQALQYADSSLAINSNLLDYNTINTASNVPFALFNEEVLFHSIPILYGLNGSRARVKPDILDLYAVGDLRRQAFFRMNADGRASFKGSYASSATNHFVGLATNELYLIKAECLARAGQINEAMSTLNSLLEKRWATGSFTDYAANDIQQALDMILLERRKELLFRGLRWTDLRRLNQEAGAGIELTREMDGTIYTLPPNSSRYVYPIPLKEIEASGIEQNQRE